MKQKNLTTTEYGKLIGISRQAVLKQINKGQLKAKKVGRFHIIELKNNKKPCRMQKKISKNGKGVRQ